MSLHSRLKLILLVSTSSLLFPLKAATSKAPSPEKSLFQKIEVKIEGQTREAFLYDPRSDRATPRPLLMVFHGAGGTALGSEKLTSLQRWAQEKNFLLLYPQGLKNVWNDGRNQKAQGHLDIEFFDRLISLMKDFHKMDPSRLYVAGMSNGGLFAFRLACERSDVIQGLASVTANMGEDLSLQCQNSKPLSVLLMTGSKDPLMPFDGGEVTGPWGLKKLGRVLSSEKTLDFWARQLKCLSKASIDKTSEEEQGIVIESRLYSPCANAKKVKGIFFINGGHTWPGGWQYLRESIIGKTSRKISASEEIVKFFEL